MRGIIHLLIGGYCCFILYQYFNGMFSPTLFGINVGETGYIAFWGLLALYSFHGAYQANRHRFR